MYAQIARALTLLAFLAIAPVAQAAIPAPRPRPALEQPAPEINCTTTDGKLTALTALRAANGSAAQNKIIILQFGSITDPLFRARVSAVERLAEKYADKALFVIIYQQEAHPANTPEALEINTTQGFNHPAPISPAERQKLAQQTLDRLQIKRQTMVVDAWNNLTAQRYGGTAGGANLTFIIDAKNLLQAGYPFMDVAKVELALDALTDGKPLSPELKGPFQRLGAADFDSSDAAMEMSGAGGRGPAALAAIIERTDLSDEQRVAILPPLAEFMADLQNFRQARPAARGNATPPPGRAGRAPATRPATPPAPGAEPVLTPAEAQAALRASADKLKAIIKKQLPEKDATTMLNALNSLAPAQRLFQ